MKTSQETLSVPKAIKGALLREFASSPGRKHISVIVSPVNSKRRRGMPSALLELSQRDKQALRRDLKQLGLLARARTLKIIGDYVLEVTPKQLLRLGELASVQAIRPNLMHRLIRSPARVALAQPR